MHSSRSCQGSASQSAPQVVSKQQLVTTDRENDLVLDENSSSAVRSGSSGIVAPLTGPN